MPCKQLQNVRIYRSKNTGNIFVLLTPTLRRCIISPKWVRGTPHIFFMPTKDPLRWAERFGVHYVQFSPEETEEFIKNALQET